MTTRLGPYRYLATRRGLVRVPADQRSASARPPALSIEEIRLNGVWTPATGLQDVPYHSRVSVRSHIIALADYDSYRYRYRLNENPRWVEAAALDVPIVLAQLNEGAHRIEIELLGRNGATVDAVGLDLSVRTPFFRSGWFYLLVGVLSASGVGLVFRAVIQNLKRKQSIERRLKTSEITAIKAQMNPHFIFNALASIQYLILSENFRQSNRYLGRFSDLMRYVLKWSGRELIPLHMEVEMLNYYLELEQLRFQGDFTYKLDYAAIEPLLDKIQVPPMLIQPYVENAVKHGLLHKSGDKRLTLTFTPAGQDLRCVIEDNGVGREEAARLRQRRGGAHPSFFSGATVSRIQLNNEVSEKKISVHFQDVPQGGLRVELVFEKVIS